MEKVQILIQIQIQMQIIIPTPIKRQHDFIYIIYV